MKTWDDWSDFEVCFKVVELLGLRTCEGQHYKPRVACWDENGFIIKFDINSWSDMGPLIVENRIAIAPHPLRDDSRGVWMCLGRDGYGNRFTKDGTNPLRAAAIVFLMMNGVKP